MMGMKYSSGPHVPTMPKDGPDSVRGRVGDARGFSPSAARNCVRAPVAIDVREKVWGVENDAPFERCHPQEQPHVLGYQISST